MKTEATIRRIESRHVVDENKRLGMLAMVAFLELNKINLMYTDDEMLKLGLALPKAS